MFVRLFLGLVAGAHALLLISSASPISAAMLLSGLIILAGLRCFHVLFGMLAGMLLVSARLVAFDDDRIAPELVGDSLVVTCSVVGFPIERDTSSRFDARCTGSVRLPERVRLSWQTAPVSLLPGDRWQLEVRLRRPSGLMNPGGFDVEKASAIAGTGATGYVVNSIRNRLIESGDAVLDRLRFDAVRRIESRLRHRESAAVITALAIGSRHAMSDAQWDRYAASGTTHLVAISGLHIGLAAVIGAFAGRLVAGLLRLQLNHRRLAMVFAMLTAVFYTALSGFGIPAQRACLMLLVAMSGWAIARETDGLSLLALAGLVILVSDPLSAFSPGFALSFLAVLTLFWTARSRAATDATSSRAAMMHRAAQLTFMQVALFVALLWASAAHFGRFSLTAPLLNLVAVPLFSAVTVPLTLFAVSAPGLDAVVLPIAALSVEWLDALASRAGRAMVVSLANPVSLMAAVGITAWAILPNGFPGRVASLACLLPLVLPDVDRPGTDCLRMTFLDVGQGTAVLAETRRHRLLYDTGPAYPGGRSAAESAIIPYLQSKGIRNLDRVIVSHADLDHSGGLPALRATVDIERIHAGEVLDGDDWMFCHSDQAWIWDGIRFDILHPGEERPETGNDASCVVRITLGGHIVLLTGDIEASAERRLLERFGEPVTLLSMPHHGSRTSSTPELVRTFSPRVAVVSAGYRNRWGLPDPDIVRRWTDRGAVVLNTATEGATSVELCRGHELQLKSRHRRDDRKLWHRNLPPDPVSRTENF